MLRTACGPLRLSPSNSDEQNYRSHFSSLPQVWQLKGDETTKPLPIKGWGQALGLDMQYGADVRACRTMDKSSRIKNLRRRDGPFFSFRF